MLWRLVVVAAFLIGCSGNPSPTAHAIICFTFDDAFATDWTVVKPILDAKDIRAGFPLHSNAPDANSSAMTWAQVKQLQDEGNEIIAHTINHSDLPTLSTDQKTAQIDNRAVYEAHGVNVRGFAYPYGAHDAESEKIVSDHFDYALATGTDSSGSEDPLDTYAIRRIAIKDNTSTEDHYRQIDTAITNSELLVFIIHSGDGSFTAGGGGTKRLIDVIDYAKAHGVAIVTPGQAVGEILHNDARH